MLGQEELICLGTSDVLFEQYCIRRRYTVADATDNEKYDVDKTDIL